MDSTDETLLAGQYDGLGETERSSGELASWPWRTPWYAWLKQALGMNDGLLSFLGANVGKLWHHPPRPIQLPTWYASTTPPSSPPLISIVTPSFNQGRFIERTLASALDQGYPRLEYIVQDGGSIDETVAVLDRHRYRLAYCASAPDHGQTHAINLGMKRATGDILAYLNSDDLLLPGSLAAVARYFDRHPNIDIVYGNRLVIDAEDREIARWVLPRHRDDVLRWADFVPQETLFWRRRAWERVGAALDESFHFAMDWDLLLRFREAGLRFARLPRFLGAFRVHDACKTRRQLSTVAAPEMDRLRCRTHGRSITKAEIHRNIRGYLLSQCLYFRLYSLGLLWC